MLITIPLLVLLLLIMIRSVPRVLATAWDSMGQQAQALVAAQGLGNGLGMLGAAAQALLLLIPTLGLGYTLFSLGRRLYVFLWNWGRPSLARRAVSGVCMLGCAGLLGFMWAPQVSLPGQPAGAPVSAGPLTQANWEPIAAGERGTVPDVVAGVVATREPVATAQPTRSPQPVVTTEPTLAPTVAPTLQPTQATPIGTPGTPATPRVGTPGVPGIASPVARTATPQPVQTRPAGQATSVGVTKPSAAIITPTPVP
jgi:putative peptide zinc metalloprotease protein